MTAIIWSLVRARPKQHLKDVAQCRLHIILLLGYVSIMSQRSQWFVPLCLLTASPERMLA